MNNLEKLYNILKKIKSYDTRNKAMKSLPLTRLDIMKNRNK